MWLMKPTKHFAVLVVGLLAPLMIAAQTATSLRRDDISMPMTVILELTDDIDTIAAPAL